jgi:hypothetical protein
MGKWMAKWMADGGLASVFCLEVLVQRGSLQIHPLCDRCKLGGNVLRCLIA